MRLHVSRGKLSQKGWVALLPFILLSSLLVNWMFLAQDVFAAPAQLSSTPGTMTLQQFQQENSGKRGKGTQPGPDLRAAKSQGKQGKTLPSMEPATMQDQNYLLDNSFVLHRPTTRQSSQPDRVKGTTIPTGSTSFMAKGSDGRLDVQIPRNSLDFSQAHLADGSAPIGNLILQIHQLGGHYVAQDSVLGTYQIQVVDSQGNVVEGVLVVKPLTIFYHYQKWELQDLNINPGQVQLSWPSLIAAAQKAQTSSKTPATSTTSTTKGLVTLMTNNAKAQTLSAQSMQIDSPLVVSSPPEVAAPVKPNLFETSGNSGQYSYTYPLNVAPGPGGFAPQLQLTYSSQITNTRYNRRAPAGDEGEGWSLSMGSITVQTYPSGSTASGTWYFLNGIDGISDRLIPTTTSGYYVTEHLSSLYYIYFNGSNWQIFDRNGTWYELGATTDSLQYMTDSGGNRTNYEWDTDKIVAAHEGPNTPDRRINIGYLQDFVTTNGYTTVRDAAIATINYGSYIPGSGYTQMGTVDFHYHAPFTSSGKDGTGQLYAVAYGTNYNCASAPPSNTTLRCDDPAQYGTIAPPSVMATMMLDSIVSYQGPDTNNHPLYKYTFTYQDQPYVTNFWSPYTLVQESAAGEHLLTQITPTVYANGAPSTRKSVVFGYTGTLRDGYNDPWVKNTDGTTEYGGQTFWQYLNHYQDQQTGVGANITYQTAHANQEGTPYITDSNGNVLDDRFDPFYCDNQANNSDTTKRCSWGTPDDNAWSLQVVTQISALGTDSSGNTTVATTTYKYSLAAVSSANSPEGGCHTYSGTSVPAQEAYCTADVWVPGYNGTQTPAHDSDWYDYYHAEYRGFNIVAITSPANNLTVDSYFSTEGWWYSESDGLDYNGGQLYQEDVYQGPTASSQTLLQETDNYYTGVGNVPTGNTYTDNSCNGNLNPTYSPCVVAKMETKTISYNGGSTNAPWVDTKDTYDDVQSNGAYATNGGYHNLLQEVISSSNAPTITKKWQYANNNQLVNGWQYYTVGKVTHSEIDDSSGHVWQCEDTAYDEGIPSGNQAPSAGWITTTTDYSTCGDSSTAIKNYTGYDVYGNAVATVDPLAVANPSWYSSQGCTLATAPAYMTSAWTAGRYTTCTTYDTVYTADLPVTDTNAFGQSTSNSYNYTSSVMLSATTDANGQTTSYGDSYDSNGNETVTTSEPGETGAYTTRQVENSTCMSSSTFPCYEIDTNSLLYSGAVTRTFYDTQGREVETRTPGPTPGDDTVVMTVYNDQLNSVWKSVSFQVADGSGWIDPNGAKDINGTAPAGTVTFADALGRTIAIQDPNWGSAQEPGIACSAVSFLAKQLPKGNSFTSCTNYGFGQAVGDTNYYAVTSDVDPNGHITKSFSDALGNVRYTQTYSGVYNGTLTVQQQTQKKYNALNKMTAVIVTDEQPQSNQGVTSVTTTMTYNDMGRLLTVNDPDQGTFTYSYDPNGNTISAVQTSGSSSRTLGYNYDLLGRLGCEQSAAPVLNATGTCSGSGPLLQNTYDTTVLGTKGSTDFPIGQLTQSMYATYYPEGTTVTVTEQFQHDQRGRLLNEQVQLGLPSSWNITSSLSTYMEGMLYNDDNQVITTSTLAGTQGYTFSPVYSSSNGVLQGLNNNGSNAANLAQLSYNEYAQLAGITQMNGAGSSPANLASEQFSYDADLRPTGMTASWLPGGGNSGQILSQERSYDNTGNVTGVSTDLATVPGQSSSGGSETQNFCYDEQNRLVWAGNSGTQPGAGNGTCGIGALSSGLSGAGYTTPYIYNNLGKIWQGPANGQSGAEQYMYCGNAPHQLSGLYPLGTICSNIGSANPVYQASYDAWGNENSRTYQGVAAQLSYDAFNHLIEYNAGSSGQELYAYDATGNRVLKRSINGGVTTLSVYVFGLEEYDYTGTGTLTSQLHYYSLDGHLIGAFDGTKTTFYLTDALGSLLASFNQSAILGERIYGPYGNQRYTVGSVNTTKGYTGQIYDTLTGLYYYNARYYDPVVGMFLSPDSVQGNAQGTNPYAYVADNPETQTDPAGQMFIAHGGGGSVYVSGNGGGGSNSSVPQWVVNTGNAANNLDSGAGSVTSTIQYAAQRSSEENLRTVWQLYRKASAVSHNVGTYTRAGTSQPVEQHWSANPGKADEFHQLLDDAQGAEEFAAKNAPTLENMDKWAGRISTGLTVASAIIDGATATTSYHNQHPNEGWGKAVLYGAVHTTIDTAIGLGCGAIGSLVCGPPCGILGGVIGSQITNMIPDSWYSGVTNFLSGLF